MRFRAQKSIERLCKRYRETNWEQKEVYADYLAQTYHYVCYSTRLLAFGAGCMRLEDNKFFKRYTEHLREEASHEKLAQRDLENLGFSLNDFPELAQTKALYESQFYKILHQDPLALMGYVLLLEAVAVQECPGLTNKITELYGPKTVSFVRLHGEEDPDHVEKAMKTLDVLPQNRLELALANLEESADRCIAMLDAIEERQGRQKWKQSA